MRSIINLNHGWKFIQKNAGLPEAFPADWQDVDLPQSIWRGPERTSSAPSSDRPTAGVSP